MATARLNYFLGSRLALLVSGALAIGCSAAPGDAEATMVDEDGVGAGEGAENATDGVEQASGTSAGALFNQRTPDQKHELTITQPHEGIMPRQWARFANRNMWHVNVNYHRCRSPNSQACATGAEAVWSRNVRNYHVVWCRQGGVSCQPPAGKLICLYAWDSREGEVLASCFDNWDTFNAQAWNALESRIEALAAGLVTGAQIGLAALGAVLSWAAEVGGVFQTISVQLPGDQKVGNVQQLLWANPLANDAAVGIKGFEKIVVLGGPHKSLAQIAPDGRRVSFRAPAVPGDYPVSYCVKRADPKPGWQGVWLNKAAPYQPQRRCGTIVFKVSRPGGNGVPANCRNPAAYQQCVARGDTPPACCATWHCP